MFWALRVKYPANKTLFDGLDNTFKLTQEQRSNEDKESGVGSPAHDAGIHGLCPKFFLHSFQLAQRQLLRLLNSHISRSDYLLFPS